jgi:hypothetical protein
MVPDRPQHARPDACIIAQQYSSAIFISMRFHSRKEKFDARLKNFIISICCFTLLKLCV